LKVKTFISTFLFHTGIYHIGYIIQGYITQDISYRDISHTANSGAAVAQRGGQQANIYSAFGLDTSPFSSVLGLP